jgi:hypothetical protein
MTPGHRTTEFWLTAAVNVAAPIVSLLVLRQVITADEGDLWLQIIAATAGTLIPLIAMMYTTRVYTQARTELKSAERRSGPMDPNQVPDQAEFGRLVSALAQRGLSPGQIMEAIGANPAGRTRRQICDALRLWLAGADALRAGLRRVDAEDGRYR